MSSLARLTSEHLTFEERLDELHEMLYTRGGIRPVNAAIEELSKIVLMQLKHAHDPTWMPEGSRFAISTILNPGWILNGGEIQEVKRTFTQVIALPEFAASVPGGDRQPIWPLDEPFRLERADVLAAALDIIDPALLRDLENRDGYDILGTAFDVLLRGRYDHSGGLATYLTPHSVATMLAEMCLADLDVPTSWKTGDPFFGDPCCGTGRFLVAGVREARRRAESDGFGQRFTDAFAGSGLIAADQSSASVAKARLNLLLFGLEHPRVFTVQDSITDSHLDLARGKMRLILTNPPFGDGKYDSPDGVARTQAWLPSVGRRGLIDPALAFVGRCLELLGDGGRVGIILPDGLVDGAALRAALLVADSPTRRRDVSIEANVSLPTATFALSGTVARTSALVLRKGGASRGFVVLSKAEHVGYLKERGGAVPDPEGDDLPAISQVVADVWAGRTDVPELHDGLATLLSRPDMTLVASAGLTTVDPSRVDPRALSARAELIDLGGESLQAYLKPLRRRATVADVERPFVSVLHVDKLGNVDWYEAAAYAPSTPGRVANAGELIISQLNPSKLRATVVPYDTPEIICSSEFGIFETTVDPYVLLVLLNDPRVRAQISPLGRGTSSSRRRIDDADIFTVFVPPIDVDATKRAKQIKAAHLDLRRAGLSAARALLGDTPTR